MLNNHMRYLVLAICIGMLGGIAYFILPSILTPGKKPNVLLIVVDTLRVDHLHFAGYERHTSPNLDKFAEENIQFRKAMATSAWTPPTMASIFTGLYASVHGHMPLMGETQWKLRREDEKV